MLTTFTNKKVSKIQINKEVFGLNMKPPCSALNIINNN